MPPKSESGEVHTKRMLVSSKVWKEKLRQGCLDRLKGRKKSPNGILISSTGMSAVRRILEEEMMDLGVVVDSPCIDHKQPRLMNAENIRSIMIGEDPEASPLVSTGSLTPTAHHFISEEELFELLAELEMEMDAADVDHYEQMLALADVEERELEERISQYQQQEDHDGPDSNDGVLCPLCTDAFLRQEPYGAIVCPNTMDSSCDLNLPNQLGLTLPNFKERLQEAYEQHAVYCSQNLSFQMGLCPPNEAMHLFAICIPCETRMLIV
jgi:hypothetical protein